MTIAPFLLQFCALLFCLFESLGLFPGKIRWGWLGIACWFASFMLTAALHPATGVH